MEKRGRVIRKEPATVDYVLNEIEARVLGALIEKQIATPDYYPMTLNALMNACNQKSSRDPVVTYDEQTVMSGLDSLRNKKLAYVFHGSDARVAKYGHIFEKTFDLAPPEVALLCVLLLRGAQTPGELRTRTASLHNFANLEEVDHTLLSLAERSDPLVVRLPRQPGARESRYQQLLCGQPEISEVAESGANAAPASSASRTGSNERIAKLEEEVRQLHEEINEMKQQFADFRKQFD
jgi:uncharacterized protein YceH (UPF0502 family)